MQVGPNAWSPTSPVDIGACEQSFKKFVRSFEAGEQEAEQAPTPANESPSKRAITNIANIIKNKSVLHMEELPGGGTQNSSKSGDEAQNILRNQTLQNIPRNALNLEVDYNNNVNKTQPIYKQYGSDESKEEEKAQIVQAQIDKNLKRV